MCAVSAQSQSLPRRSCLALIVVSLALILAQALMGCAGSDTSLESVSTSSTASPSTTAMEPAWPKSIDIAKPDRVEATPERIVVEGSFAPVERPPNYPSDLPLRGPTLFAVSPSGRWMAVAGENEQRIQLFRDGQPSVTIRLQDGSLPVKVSSSIALAGVKDIVLLDDALVALQNSQPQLVWWPLDGGKPQAHTLELRAEQLYLLGGEVWVIGEGGAQPVLRDGALIPESERESRTGLGYPIAGGRLAGASTLSPGPGGDTFPQYNLVEVDTKTFRGTVTLTAPPYPAGWVHGWEVLGQDGRGNTYLLVTHESDQHLIPGSTEPALLTVIALGPDGRTLDQVLFPSHGYGYQVDANGVFYRLLPRDESHFPLIQQADFKVAATQLLSAPETAP